MSVNTDEIALQQAWQQRQNGRSWDDIGSGLGLSGNSIRCRVLRWRRHNNEDANKEEIAVLGSDPSQEEREAIAVFTNRKQSVDPDWRRLVEIASHTQDVLQGMDATQRVIEIKIDTDEPVEILFTGDWHLGDGATDHRRWMADMEYLLDKRNMFMFSLGDLRQNMRTFKVLSAVLGQVLSPKLQASLLKGIVNELAAKGKLLTIMDGNHEDMDATNFGEVLQSYLLEKTAVPRCDNRGLVKLHVGKQLYTILLFHKSRFRSAFRPAHSAFRESEMSYPAHIVAGAHDHRMGIEIAEKYLLAQEAGMGFGGTQYLIKVGTYQESEFGWKYFHDGGKPKMPVVTLWPDEHEMTVRETLRPAGSRIK